MKIKIRILSLFCSVMLFMGLFTPAYAFTSYDKKSDDEHWSYQYAEDLYEHGVLTREELDTIYFDDPISPEDAFFILSKVEYLNENYGSFLPDDMTIESCTQKYSFILPEEDVVLSRGAFVSMFVSLIDPDTIFDRNIVLDGMIPDVNSNDSYYEDVYTVYRWGLLNGVDADGTFAANLNVTFGQLVVVVDRLLNPNVRTNLSMYSENAVKIQSETYPMIYQNQDTGLYIEVTQETHYQAVCYVAHIRMMDPSHLKTIYPYLEWSVIGVQASEVDSWLNPILMVNGDFRSASYGEKLGIIRNRQIVNGPDVNGIGLTLNGNLFEVSGTPQSVLDLGIRETFTFGPVLVRDGEVIPTQNASRAPRTFIGQIYHEDGLLEYYIIVADGRQEGYSMGLTNYEMACILQEKGCDFGYNLDGGGSSVMVFDHQVLNRPSDGGERADADYLYIK